MTKTYNDFNEIKIDFKEISQEITGITREFPKYTTQLINIANQNAQGTRPIVVGQMSELIKLCPSKTYSGWKEWYLKKYPNAIDNATEKIVDMIEKMKESMEKIDRNMIRQWVEDLVIDKTAEGLIIQEIVLKKLAELKGVKYKTATPEEESKNIDGYLGEQPVQIKPKSYMSKKSSVREQITVPIYYYKKTVKYLYIYFEKGTKLSKLDDFM